MIPAICIGPAPTPPAASLHALDRYRQRFQVQATGRDLSTLVKLRGLPIERELLQRYDPRYRRPRRYRGTPDKIFRMAEGGIFLLDEQGCVVTVIDLLSPEQTLADVLLRALGFRLDDLPAPDLESRHAA